MVVTRPEYTVFITLIGVVCFQSHQNTYAMHVCTRVKGIIIRFR